MLCLHLFLIFIQTTLSFSCGNLNCVDGSSAGSWSVNCTGLMGFLEYDCITMYWAQNWDGYCKVADKGADIYSPKQNQLIAFFHCTPGSCNNSLFMTFQGATSPPTYTCGTGTSLPRCIAFSMEAKQKKIDQEKLLFLNKSPKTT